MSLISLDQLAVVQTGTDGHGLDISPDTNPVVL